MITEFYKAGDCSKNIYPAQLQLDNQEKWKDTQKLKYWKSVRQNLIDKINQLWRFNYVEFWEEDWFPGHEVFIEDIKALGYAVENKLERRNGCGMTQHFYKITLPTTKTEKTENLK